MPRVPKKATDSGQTTKLHPPFSPLFCSFAVNLSWICFAMTSSLLSVERAWLQSTGQTQMASRLPRQRGGNMARKERKYLIHRTVAPIRILCYLLGPLAIGLIFSRYGQVLSVRFHIFHSMLMTGFWASLWGALWGIEHSAPWF